MKKNILSWFFIALFIIPEIFFGLTQRTAIQILGDLLNIRSIGFVSASGNLPGIGIIRLILFFQFIGVVGLFIILIKKNNSSWPKLILLFLLTILILLIIFAFVMSYLFNLLGIG
jgi:hypothetical protein